MTSAVAPRAPAVSIIVPCYKHARYLPEAIASVIAQSYADWECIVVDDGSPDDTAEVAAALIAQYPSQQLRLVRQTNQGLGAARNSGVRASRGRYILPLDADDLLAPDYLAKTVALLEQHPELAIAHTDVQQFGVNNRRWNTGPFTLEALMRDNYIAYCSLYRREVWDAIGGYDPTRRLSHEDWEFWLHALKRGFRGARVEGPLFHYRTAAQSMVTACNAERPKMLGIITLNHPGLFGPAREEAARELLGAEANPVLRAPHRPRVSVVVTTNGRSASLEDALRSALAQSFQDFEIVLVNDGGPSVDRLVESLDAGAKIQSLRLPRARGKGAARNAGIAAARGSYLAYLDEEDRHQPEHLASLLAALEDGTHQVAWTDARRPADWGARSTALHGHEFVSAGRPDVDRVLQGAFAPLSCTMHERRCVEASGAGPFDETLGALEEWELLVRFSQKYTFASVARTTCVLGERLPSELEPLRRAAGNIIRHRHRTLFESRPKARAVRYRQRMAAVTKLLGEGKPHAALEEMARVVLADPTFAEAYNDLAVLEFQAGRVGDARWAIGRSLSLDPDNATARQTLAVIQAAADPPAAEIPGAPEMPLRISPAAYQELLPKVEALVAAKQAGAAIAALQEFVARHADCAEAFNDLAAVLHGAGRSAEALGAARRAVALEPGAPPIVCTLAMIELALGATDDAARTLLPALNAHPRDAGLLFVANEIGRRAEEQSREKAVRLRPLKSTRGPRILALAFSRDRELQLDATLRSLQLHWEEAASADLKVLTKATSELHRTLYRQLGLEHPRVELIAETDFRAQLLSLLGAYDQILFLVDDNLVVRPFSLEPASAALEQEAQLLGVSLRLGKNTTHCYAMNSAQRVPLLIPAHGMNRFRWPGAQHDFGYPLEVSSSLYRAPEMAALLSRIPFRNPNQLEAAMAQRAGEFAEIQPELLCFDRSVTFCNPINMVQTTYTGNRAGTALDQSAAALARRYANGERIRVEAYRELVPIGCHQEVELSFERAPELDKKNKPAAELSLG